MPSFSEYFNCKDNNMDNLKEYHYQVVIFLCLIMKTEKSTYMYLKVNTLLLQFIMLHVFKNFY
jgi:hypothetical protein